MSHKSRDFHEDLSGAGVNEVPGMAESTISLEPWRPGAMRQWERMEAAKGDPS